MKSRWGVRLLLAVAVAAVVAAVIAGTVALGPPHLERNRKLDGVRVMDLASIERLIVGFAKLHKTVPADLAALAKEPGYSVPRGDPESGKPYEYEVLSNDSYRLCARFTTTQDDNDRVGSVYAPGTMWSHGAGKQCFNRRVNLGSPDSP